MADQPTAEVPLCEQFAVADVDSHIIEPADLWTSRISSTWGGVDPNSWTRVVVSQAAVEAA